MTAASLCRATLLSLLIAIPPLLAPAAAQSAASQAMPDGAGRLLPLPRLTLREQRELADALRGRLIAEKAYAPAAAAIEARLPPLPPGLSLPFTLARAGAGGQQQVIRAGFLRAGGQPQLWLLGVSLGRETGLNPDAAGLDALLAEHLAAREAAGREIPVEDLEHRVVRLSYVSPEAALRSLKMMGFNLLDDTQTVKVDNSQPPLDPNGQGGQQYGGGGGQYGQQQEAPPAPVVGPPRQVDGGLLPLIAKLPEPDALHVGLVGEGAQVGRGDLGISMIPSAATRLAPDALAAPTSQLLVMFDPRDPGQFARVLKALHDVVDKPARQVLVEGMVLEVSEEGLDELGVQWTETRGGDNTLTLGGLTVGAGRVFNFEKDTNGAAVPLVNSFRARIQALIRSGKAEVLSRPSVLTLDNRQATIRVGTDIPIATSKDASSAAEARVSFSFQYLPTGILLNVRPRSDAEGREIAMLIDTTVSSTVAGRDLELRSTGGELMASAPTIATRRVQTYARIANATPLIIGGLVSRDRNDRTDKVPLLGDIPLLGKLFGAEQKTSSKREVIIVLTPSIMAEQHSAARTQPKDDDAFDSIGNALFRDVYRLRAEDVFDTRYIRTNQRLRNYRDTVEHLAAQDSRLAEKAPFRAMAGRAIPGESHLVIGMIYEMLTRLNRGQDIEPDKMVFFNKAHEGDFASHSLLDMLREHGRGSDARSFFTNNPGMALTLSFVNHRRMAGVPGNLLAEPRPEVSLTRCPDRREWARLMWELNQPLPDGSERYTILIHDESDLERLARTIALKRLISVNGGEEQATISNFLVGRTISVPEIQPSQKHLLDARVARYFFLSQHHYPAFETEQERIFAQLDAAFRRPEVAPLLDGRTLPVPARIMARPLGVDD